MELSPARVEFVSPAVSPEEQCRREPRGTIQERAQYKSVSTIQEGGIRRLLLRNPYLVSAVALERVPLLLDDEKIFEEGAQGGRIQERGYHRSLRTMQEGEHHRLGDPRPCKKINRSYTHTHTPRQGTIPLTPTHTHTTPGRVITRHALEYGRRAQCRRGGRGENRGGGGATPGQEAQYRRGAPADPY